MKKIVLYTTLLSMISCAGLNSSNNSNYFINKDVENSKTSNSKGWNSTNCAHILPDGSCAHIMGPNSNPINIHNDFINNSDTSNSKGWNSTNCAHILADGSCAHIMGPNIIEQNRDVNNPINIHNGSINNSNCAHIMANGECAHPL